MKKITILYSTLLTILILTTFAYLKSQKGYIDIEFTGITPNSVFLDKDPDYNQGKRELEIRNNNIHFNSNYAHYEITINYDDEKNLDITLCNQNNWYKNKIEISRSENRNNMIEINYSNQDDIQIKHVNYELKRKHVIIGICG